MAAWQALELPSVRVKCKKVSCERKESDARANAMEEYTTDILMVCFSCELLQTSSWYGGTELVMFNTFQYFSHRFTWNAEGNWHFWVCLG